MTTQPPKSPGAEHRDVISVDVEDYFHVEAFAGVVDRTSWDRYPGRVERNTRRLLDIFDESGIKGTYFILGWVAERYPGLVREISSRGHELACHSYAHRPAFTMTPAEFAEDTRRARDVIEQAAGLGVRGYRAPTFSITKRSLWAFEILVQAGFAYDSSVFPVRHDLYGMPDAPRVPFRVNTPSGEVTEFPMTTFRLGNTRNWPVGGGGYLRMLPSWYTRMGIRRARRQGVTVITYIHPWEIDRDQPRLRAPLRSRLRHYTNLSRMERRLREVVRQGSYSSFRDCGLCSPTLACEIEELAGCLRKNPWPK